MFPPPVSPPRSALYVPADNARALAKARSLRPDAFILDLEDAVSPGARPAARTAAAAALAAGGFAAPLWLRPAGLGAPELAWVAALPTPPAALLLPKVESAAALEPWAGLGLALWAMVETPLGVLRAGELAAHPLVAGLVAGTNDLASLLRCGPGRAPLHTALSQTVLAARAHGKVPLDAVYNDVRDPDGLFDEAAHGRTLGFAGKTVIHPAQLGPVHAAFAPTPDEVNSARELLAAWEAARAQGRGVATVHGHLVEHMHAQAARELLARAETDR